jgi:trehalose synthase
MAQLLEVQIAARSLDRFLPLLGEQRIYEARKVIGRAREVMQGRVFWHVNSTARGGGVAEILQSILPYARGAGIDARWLVIGGTPEFFRITKRLHNALHGSEGDGSELGEREREAYEDVLRLNAAELLEFVCPGDPVVLHDPQTAGIAPYLVRAGAIVIWRCHIGLDRPNEEVERGWSFLTPYLEPVAATVFSREEYVPRCCDHGRNVVIRPSIDPFSTKNQQLDEAEVRAILVQSGIVAGPLGGGSPSFLRQDGTPARVNRRADVVRNGSMPSWETPLVVQVSRWDHLKDPVGVMEGFAQEEGVADAGAELVLAGPSMSEVADDPESAAVFDEVVATWRHLPTAVQSRIHMATLPMADIEENAAIVNALQRHAAVIVQKSLNEGFGLTVTEAMWKGRPIIASAVGGIRDQITDGVHGLLLDEPTHLKAFGTLLGTLLADGPFAERLGEEARERVRAEYLGVRHLTQYADLLVRLCGSTLSAQAS